MYSPATSLILTSPAGNTAVRLNGAAIDSTGRAVGRSAAVTVSVCTLLM